ncbi:biotin/lipoate A/B protein ligase, partial [Candidatus Magnetoovum chiemensis]
MDRWRVIEFDAYDGASNMAIDEALSFYALRKESPPTLRLYSWKEPTTSIGAFQNIADIDFDYCAANNIPIVRRPTGGRAVLHFDELTYSFSCPKIDGLFSDNLLDNYKTLNSAFFNAFLALGIDVQISGKKLKRHDLTGTPICFASTSYSEITVLGKKIMGSAQRRYSEGFLQQGSIPINIDMALMQAIFKHAPIDEVFFYTYPANINIDAIIAAVKTAFEQTFSIRFISEGLTVYEKGLYLTLLKERYQSRQWT